MPSIAPVPGPLNLRSSDVSTDSFQVSWDHSANDIVQYKLFWTPIIGGDTKEVSTWKIVKVYRVYVLLEIFTNQKRNVKIKINKLANTVLDTV